jgi:hypothetical protein
MERLSRRGELLTIALLQGKSQRRKGSNLSFSLRSLRDLWVFALNPT